jgi:hypothetical protein
MAGHIAQAPTSAAATVQKPIRRIPTTRLIGTAANYGEFSGQIMESQKGGVKPGIPYSHSMVPGGLEVMS